MLWTKPNSSPLWTMDTNYRFMRILLFFDLPVLTAVQRRNYRRFVKLLKKNGFAMMQESVYVKMCLNQSSADVAILTVKNNKPPEGNVFALIVTERQFSSIEFIVGDYATDVVQTDERLLEL